MDALAAPGRIIGSAGTPSLSLHPLIYSKVPKRLRKTRSVRDGLTHRAWVADIQGALTAAVAIQYVSLWRRLNHMTLSDKPDRLTWRWTPTGTYTASPCYKAMFTGAIADPHWRITWRSIHVVVTYYILRN